MKTITTKFGTMKKAVEWVVYPDQNDGILRLQSDHRCIMIDKTTGNARLSRYEANYPVVAIDAIDMALELANAEQASELAA